MGTENIISHLENTFGKIPTKITNNLKYFKCNEEEDELTCNLCDQIVKICSTDKQITTVKFFDHLQSQNHKSKTTSNEEIYNKLKTVFQEKIPTVVQNNFYVLELNRDGFYCVVCEKVLTVSNCPSVTEITFAQHFLTDRHENMLQTFNNNLNLLISIYGGFPDAIFYNSQYLNLTQDGSDYFCTICEVTLKVNHKDLEKTKELFTMHMETERHLTSSQYLKATSRIPILKEIYSSTPIPWYVMSNIEYFSSSRSDILALYCNLCNESFEINEVDLTESEQSLKQHIFSHNHVECLKDRRDESDEVYLKLRSLEELPEDIMDKLCCISFSQNQFSCEVCNVCFSERSEKDGLKVDLLDHLRSSFHKNAFAVKNLNQSVVLDDLEDLFGAIPCFITKNLSHIEFKEGITFECTLCKKQLRAFKTGDNDENIAKTEDHFATHLQSNKHQTRLNEMRVVEYNLKNQLKSFYSRPTSWYLDQLVYQDKDGENYFFCSLCNVKINIVQGSKKEQLTRLNLRSHLRSPDHFMKLKIQANKKCLAVKELKSIFKGVSNLILNNIQHLVKSEDCYFCSLCKVEIVEESDDETLENQFHSHLYGATHQSLVQALENRCHEASKFLEQSFGRIPEYIFRNLDFLSVSNDGLYCNPCQMSLPLKNCLASNDLKEVHSLRYHLESKEHEEIVGFC